VKGGLSVDIGLRAFMPASRSGARDVPEMEKLVGQDIVCRIIKLEVAEEDAVGTGARSSKKRPPLRAKSCMRICRKAQ